MAAEAYDAAIARWPDQPHAWLGRGNVAYADGDRKAAADAYLRAIGMDRRLRDAAARNNLAQLLAEAGCSDEARKQIERAAELAERRCLRRQCRTSRAKIDATAENGSAPARSRNRAWPD